MLEGEAGAGKTTLWQSAVDRADGLVLATRPLETETKLAYAGVGDLLEGLHDRLGSPEPQARALRAALLLESPDAGVVDERAVALGFLGLLVSEAPLLLAVDDLQWLDRQSARVLAFAAHRVGEAPVAFLVALRTEGRSRLSFVPERVLPSCTNLPVRGLDVESIHRLIRERLGLVLPQPTLRAVCATAAGNPFFALELARAAHRARGAAPGAGSRGSTGAADAAPAGRLADPRSCRRRRWPLSARQRRWRRRRSISSAPRARSTPPSRSAYQLGGRGGGRLARGGADPLRASAARRCCLRRRRTARAARGAPRSSRPPCSIGRSRFATSRSRRQGRMRGSRVRWTKRRGWPAPAARRWQPPSSSRRPER